MRYYPSDSTSFLYNNNNMTNCLEFIIFVKKMLEY